jgi:hypothetical protein
MIDQANEAKLVSVGLDNRQRVDRVDLDSRRYVRHDSLPQGRRLAASGWLQSSSGYGFFEAKMPSEKNALHRNLRGAECEFEVEANEGQRNGRDIQRCTATLNALYVYTS